MENMSMVPHYLPASRNGYKYGNITALDGIITDGLTDVYDNTLMGACAEICAADMKFSREEQDAYAIESYKRAAAAWENGRFSEEVVPVTVSTRKGDIIVDKDEEYKNVFFDKIPGLKPVFKKDGTVTAANASTINDGAAAVILVSGEKLKELGLTPLAKIEGFADAEQAPEWFTTTPSLALPIAAKRAGIEVNNLDFVELNEAFSVVALANNKILNLSADKVNVNGGAVALGHPLGASGARILVTLIHVLKQNNGQYGGAAICNGGGGASAMVIKNC
jgi:acetyl-CoA C-acetyltransferase